MKKAFITAITGQDGSYIAGLLLSKEYEVHWIIRRALDTTRARKEFGFEAKTAFKEGIKRTIKWYRNTQ